MGKIIRTLSFSTLHYENNFVMCHTAEQRTQDKNIEPSESTPIEHKTRLHTSQQREIIKQHHQGNINSPRM